MANTVIGLFEDEPAGVQSCEERSSQSMLRTVGPSSTTRIVGKA
jgi:hypothetical protein